MIAVPFNVLLIIPRNVQRHTAHRDEDRKRRAAVAHERQRHAGERNDARDGRHVDERLERDDRAEADQDHAPELVAGALGEPEHAERDDREERHEHAGADEAELFRDDRKDGIIDRRRQIAIFRGRLAVSRPPRARPTRSR